MPWTCTTHFLLKPSIAILNYCCQSTLTILKSYKILRGVNIVFKSCNNKVIYSLSDLKSPTDTATVETHWLWVQVVVYLNEKGVFQKFSLPNSTICLCHNLGWLYSVDSQASLCVVVLVNSVECATVFNSFKIYRSLQNLCIRFHHLMACPKRQFVFHWPFTYFCGHDLVTPSPGTQQRNKNRYEWSTHREASRNKLG